MARVKAMTIDAIDAINAVTEGMKDMIAPVETIPAEKTKRKPAVTKPAGKPVAAPKGKADKPAKPVKPAKPEPVAKPAPVLFRGYEVADGTDVTVLENALKAGSEAFETINRKDTDLADAYLSLGEFLSETAPLFKSQKLFGQFVQKEVPASSTLDPSLRSNCKWLWEALNKPDHEAADILSVLGGINHISHYKSANPSVIRREYNAIKNAKAETDKLREAGIDPEDDEAIALAKQKEKDAAKAKAKAEREMTLAAVEHFLSGMKLRAGDLLKLRDVMTRSLTGLEGAVAGEIVADYMAFQEELEDDNADE